MSVTLPTGPGSVHLVGGPCDPIIPPTPLSHDEILSSSIAVCERDLLSYAPVLGGRPIAYRAERNGKRLQRVIAEQGKETSLSSASSADPLGLHGDNLVINPCPHFLVLKCVRVGASGEASTTIVDFRDICCLLDPDTLAALRQPEYQISTPETFRDALGRVWAAPQPILSGPPDMPEMRFRTYGIKGRTQRARQALQALFTVLQRPGVVQRVHWKAGDVLVLNQRKVLHGRDPFIARYDGTDRFLLRMYVHCDLWPYRTQSDAPSWLF